MEHEVNVPFSVGSVRAALAEPERVARCVPGLQLDGAEGAESPGSAGSPGSAKAAGGGAGKTEGRLRVRIGNSTVTYRGSLTVTPKGEEFAVKGSGTEARGSGTVRLNLTVVPRRSKEGEGTRLVFSGTVKGDGRIGDFEEKSVTAAGHRLLERFGKALGESIGQDPPQALDSPDAPAAEPSTSESARGIGEPGDNDRVIPGIPGPDSRESRTSGETAESGDAARPGDTSDTGDARDDSGTPDEAADGSAPEETAAPDSPERTGVFETEIPPPSLDPLHDDESDDEAAAEAEAAHARRTMIGRSAEEVDHAPPRGRYAPIPVPEPIANSAALRWVAPAAAAVVAGAVFIGRALRRRR
ncbi:MAG TPA: hypothetical protein VNS49_06150 [Streptomyces sp.]|nr:hypothetical protein [Streptomyces sp.]